MKITKVMKITEDALETALAAAKESEVPLLLAGDKGVITDVVINPAEMQFDTWAGQIPFGGLGGLHRYGKVLTKSDRELGPGYNLRVRESGYQFLDEDGKEVPVEVISEPASPQETDQLLFDGCEAADDSGTQ